MNNPTINCVSAHQVIVPAREGHVDCPSFGPSLFDKTPKWMLQVFTDTGLVGYGESLRGTLESDLRWGIQQLLGKKLLSLSWLTPVPPNLEGNDAFHPQPPKPYPFHEFEFPALGHLGLQVAVLDLWGKYLQVPLHTLLGGAQREQVATSWWFGRSDPDHAARQTEVGMKHGFRAVKIKGTAEDDIVGIVRAVKSVAGADAPVVIDPNRRFYRLSETLKIAGQLEDEFSNVMLEDPFPFDVREWQLLRKKTSLPVVLHTGDLGLGMSEHCCDHVNVGYPLSSFLGDAHMAFRFKKLCWHGSGLELGILDAYMVHCAAVAKACALPGDAMGHRIRCDDLIEEELELREGAIRLPTRPGLGVTLDHTAMKRYLKNQFELKS